jgi:glycosyltransferase involved in cell wall biosynthesis
MRIAYLAPYQGESLLQRRPIVRNRSMSNRIKIELIATLLRAASHDVEIISQGEVIESSCSFYPSFSEPERFHSDIPVYYASSLPIRRLNGLWSNTRTLHVFRQRHTANPYQLVIVFNLKGPQITCANYAIRRLALPVILEYEDDSFSSVHGEVFHTCSARLHTYAVSRLLRAVSGCLAVSPYLLSQLPTDIPQLLLRGVAGQDIISASRSAQKRNIVLFSGTHIRPNGVEELIKAWSMLNLTNWELHITGYGQLTEYLRQMAQEVPGVSFHGLVDRFELVRLMCAAKICINPFVISPAPGSVFAFKIIEYLAAGAHVITTPMGQLERELESGISYMADNSPATIAAALEQVIEGRLYERRATNTTHDAYGPEAVTAALDRLLNKVIKKESKATWVRPELAADLERALGGTVRDTVFRRHGR